MPDAFLVLTAVLANLLTIGLAYSPLRQQLDPTSLRRPLVVALPSAFIPAAALLLGGASSPRAFALADAAAFGLASVLVTAPVLVVALANRRWVVASPSRRPFVLVPVCLAALLSFALPFVALLTACVVAHNCL